MNSRIFEYGTHRYTYYLIRQERKTISLTVEPCLNIIVKVPESANDERIERFLKKKWLWLNKQLTFFEKYRQKHYEKEFISGESFYYLGRQFKMTVIVGDTNSVSLSKGKLTMTSTKSMNDGKHNFAILERWYKNRRQIIFNERYKVALKHFNYDEAPKLVIRAMSRRWGSFHAGKSIILNPLLIQAPKEAIDYVIIHELCHMKYKNHDIRFYNLLESKMPKWKETKEKLELLLS